MELKELTKVDDILQLLNGMSMTEAKSIIKMADNYLSMSLIDTTDLLKTVVDNINLQRGNATP
jgi:hypothetical protein